MTDARLLGPLSCFGGPSLDFSSLLCADVGQVVLRHLASTQDRVRICRFVSKKCRQLVDSQVLSLRANLKSLSTRDAALALQLHFPCLQRLSFDRAAPSESSYLLEHLASNQPQLLSHLQELDLSCCQGVEADALSALLQAANSLNSLILPMLSACVTSSKQDFMRVISTHGTQVQHLKGAGDYINAETLPHVVQLTALRTLDTYTMSQVVHIPPHSLQSLAALSHLQRLHLGNDLACYDLFELAADLPALQQLEFSYVQNTALNAQDLAPLRRSSTLERLRLSGVHCTDALLDVLGDTPVLDLSLHAGEFFASPKGAAFVAGQLQRLQLEVSTAAGSSMLKASLPVLGAALASLSLTLYKRRDDLSGLVQAVFGLPALQDLSLHAHYGSFNEQELQDLPVASQLTQLSLANHFGDAALCQLLRSTAGLRHLSLSSCSEIGSTGLGCVLRHCRRLSSVRLELMRGATAAGVACLASGQCMSRVVLEGCRNVSAEECGQLMRMLNKPDLDIIKLR